MDEKIRAIENHILKDMAGRSIQYQSTRSLHKFRIDGSTSDSTHWLYLSFELVADSTPVILINLINIYHVVDTLTKAPTSKWLFLSANGIREVDENFTTP